MTVKFFSGFKAGDLWGGLAAMLVALPQSIAFGIVVFSAVHPSLVSQGAVAGTIGAIAVGIIAPLLGGTPRLISSPCAPAAAFLGGILAESWLKNYAGTDAASTFLVIGLITLFSGIFQLVFALIGGGRVIKFIPYPVVAGYLSSVGIIILLGQVPRLVGMPATSKPHDLFLHAADWNFAAVAIGLTTIALMAVSPRLTKIVPAPITGLAGGILTFLILAGIFPELRVLEKNPLLIGTLQGEFSADGFLARFASAGGLDLRVVGESALAGATLAVVLSIDTLKSCVIVDTVTHSRSDSNKELRGQGFANIAAALTGGIAGAGTLGATLVNISSGGTSRISGILSGVFSLAAFALLAPFIAWVPVPALAGILVLVGIRMVDWKLFELLRKRATFLDFVVILTVIGTALQFSLMAAAGAGFVLSAVFFLREQIRGSVIHRRMSGVNISSRKSRLPAEGALLKKEGKRIVIYELTGSLFFGNTDKLLNTVIDDMEHAQFVIFGMRRIRSIDSTAVHMFEQLEALLRDRQGRLILTDLPSDLSSGQKTDAYLKDAGLLKPASHIIIFDDLYEALEWAEDFILTDRGLYHPHHPPLELAEIELFQNLNPAFLGELAQCVEERNYQDGDTIFRAGDHGDEIYFVRRGVVKILLQMSVGKARHLASFGRGDFFGDMSFVDTEVRSADAIAASEVDLYSLSRERFEEVLKTDPALGRDFYAALVRALALRFRSVHAELRSME